MRHARHPHRSLCVAALLVVSGALVALSGCGGSGGSLGSRRTRAGSSAPLRLPDPNRIDAILGQRMVVPVDGAMLAALAGVQEPFTAIMHDGTPLAASFARVQADALPPLPQINDPRTPSVHLTTWLSDTASRWSSTPVTLTEARNNPLGVVLIVEPPPVNRTDKPAGNVGQSKSGAVVRRDATRALTSDTDPQIVPLRIGTMTMRVQLIASLRTRALTDAEAWTGPWEATLTEQAGGDRTLRTMLSHEAGNPFARWRSRLALDGLTPTASPESLGDPVIDGLARQEEQRWQEALTRLWKIDKSLLASVRARLAGTANFGEDRLWAPVWEARPDVTLMLRDDLLNPDLDTKARVERVRQWLADQPAALAWISDDAGVLVDAVRRENGPQSAQDEPAPRIALVSVHVLNMGERAMNAWAAPAGNDGSPELHPVDAWHTFATLSPTVAPPSDDELPGGPRRNAAPRSSSKRAKASAGLGLPASRFLAVGASGWREELPALDSPVAVLPPGLSTAKFFADWNLAALRAGQARPAEDGWATAALVHRAPTLDNNACEQEDMPGPWQVFVECRSALIGEAAAGAGSEQRDTLWVFVGPASAPTYVWRIDALAGPTGGAVFHGGENSSKPAQSLTPCVVNVDPLKDRWVVRLTLPDDAIERDGVLRLGIVRVDGRGMRSAWPRPMLPWQNEPGRAALDMDAWIGSGER